MRLVSILLLVVGLAACDSGGSGGENDDLDPGTIAGSYNIETLRFTSTDGAYDVNVVDTLLSSRVFIQSDSREFDLEYQVRGSSSRRAVSSSYSISGQSITFEADEDSEGAFLDILLPSEFQLRYENTESDRLVGERQDYTVNLKEYDPQKYSAPGVEGTLHIVLQRQ